VHSAAVGAVVDIINATMPPFFSSLRRRAVRYATALLAVAAFPAGAGITVQVEGVDGELRSNVLIFLSVERYRERNDIDADTMQRLYDRIDNEVRRALKPLGYYEPDVAATYVQQGGDWRVSIV